MLYQLSYSRKRVCGGDSTVVSGGGWWIRTTVGVRRRVYSPLPLATRATPHIRLSLQPSLQRLLKYPAKRFEKNSCHPGADGGTRTRDLRFTKPLLCRLSYVSCSGTPAPWTLEARGAEYSRSPLGVKARKHRVRRGLPAPRGCLFPRAAA